MPKFPTLPLLYDNMLQIKIIYLKKNQYLIKNKAVSGSLFWTNRGVETARISFTVYWSEIESYVTLRYMYNKEPREYKVQIVFEKSNLQVGEIPFFICPRTYQKARKLYLIDGMFLHRTATNSAMYESQTVSKKYRQIEKTYGLYFKQDELYSKLCQQHFKKTYAGKPTRTYLKLIKQIRKAESIPYHEIEALFMI